MQVIHGVDVASNKEMESSHWPNADRVDVSRSEGVIREALRFKYEVENGQHAEKLVNSASISINSSSKTKTMQLSQNSYFEESFEIYH